MSRAQIARIAIFGGGAAGAEIARAALEAGLAVALLEEDAGAAERAAHYLSRALPARHAANLTVGTDLGAANGFDLAIEASRAPAPALAKLVAALAAQSAQGLIAAQVMRDTADLPALAAALPDPARLCGLAIAAPAHLRRLIEIIPAPQTAPETVAAIEDFAAALGKIAITPARGPLVPTLAARLYHAADTLLLDGSTPWEIDEAMEAYGLSPPPYEAQDLSGLDAALSARRGADLPGAREIPILSRMVQEGRLGAQAGVGWYRYPGGGGKVVDPLLEDMMVEEAYFARQPRRAFTAEDITARLLLAVTNGAFALLGAGDAAEIDLAAIEGLGLPRDRPGPIALARECGAAGVLARIEALSPEDPGFWRPAPALRAEAG